MEPGIENKTIRCTGGTRRELESGSYQIEVRGILAFEWRDCLGGLAARTATATDGVTVTVLEGRVADQRELCGVLLALCDLNHPLRSVTRLDPPRDSVSAALSGF